MTIELPKHYKETSIAKPNSIGNGLTNAAQTATNYIVADSKGIKIANAKPATATTYQRQTANDTTFYVNGKKRSQIRADGLHIYVESTESEAANFTANGAQIGRTNQNHVNIDYHSMRMVDKNGETYFHVSDLRGEDGYYTITEHFIGDGSETYFQLSSRLHEWGFSSGEPILIAAYVNDVATAATITGSLILGYLVEFSEAPAEGSDIKVVYKSDSRNLKAYTIGARSSDGEIGPFSFVVGVDSTASGIASYAEGRGAVASGDNSHAEGDESVASGYSSHAESGGKASGDNSHAEGSGSASGLRSHAEGMGTAYGEDSHAEGYSVAFGDQSHSEGTSTAMGVRSHAQNRGTIAGSDDQTTMGRFNVRDNNSQYSLIIGNGADNDNRSNALTVDWNGFIEAANVHNIITVCPANEVASTGNTLKIPVKQIHKVGNGFEVVNGYVRCLLDGYISVEGMQSYSGFNNGSVLQVIVYRCNTASDITKELDAITDKDNAQYHSIRAYDTSTATRACLTVPRRIFAVTAGSFICIAGGNTSGSTGKALASGNRNYFTLEYV